MFTMADGMNGLPANIHVATGADVVGKTHTTVSGKTGLNTRRQHCDPVYISKLSVLWGFCHSSVGKVSACNAGDPIWIPGSGRSAGEGIDYPLQYSWASLVVQLVKNLPAMRETSVPSLDWEDPLEKG